MKLWRSTVECDQIKVKHIGLFIILVWKCFCVGFIIT